MNTADRHDKSRGGTGASLEHAWHGIRSSTSSDFFSDDTMPNVPQPGGIPNPQIRIVGTDGKSFLEQIQQIQQERPTCEQSQGSYSFVDSDDGSSVLTPSEDFDHTEDIDSHRLGNERWPNSATDALERKPRIEESVEELTLASSDQASHGDGIDRAAAAPFRDRNGGLPTLNVDDGLGQSPYLHITGTPLHEEPEEPLEDRLLDALVNNDTTWGFFPANSLTEIITESTVKKELRNVFTDPVLKDWGGIPSFARKICGTPSSTVCFRKIFAILVMMGKTAAIFGFMDEKVSDSDLPLTPCYIPSKKTQIFGFQRSQERYTGAKVECFNKGWNKIEMKNFEQWQWTTLAPIFKQSDEDKIVSHYSSPTGKITLPFIQESGDSGMKNRRMEEFAGGGGRVTKVRIHPDHHCFHYKDCPRNSSTIAASRASSSTTSHGRRKCECRFAIKQLHSTDETFHQFKKEVDVLRRFSNEKHNHLISLLATYEHNKDYYLIFPWAQATLKTYWQEIHPNPSLDQQTVLWVAEQCKGIAYGVLSIHQYRSWSNSELDPTAGQNVQFGHHGDIKPENILWFQDNVKTNAKSGEFKRGTLKLTDFGLASINTARTVSRQLFGFPCSIGYCAPEAQLLNCGPPGRQYDMWTLGCLYLEFVTWTVGGCKLLKNFETARKTPDPRFVWEKFPTDTFFEVITEGNDPGFLGMKANVKPQVTKFIERLHHHPRCTMFIHDFLNMIQSGLLKVRENRHSEVRLTSEQVHMELARMLKRCMQDKTYGCTPCPWKDTSGQ